MLKGLRNVLENVINKGYETNKNGNIQANIKVDLFKGKTIEIRHYNNLVAIIECDSKKIVKNNKWWNYSPSTTRLCNDIIKYFDDCELA